MKIVIWGTGKVSNEVMKYRLIDDVEVVAVVDNAKEKWGTTFCNYEIVSPDYLLSNEYDKILILTTKGKYEVKKQLLAMGVKEEEILTVDSFGGFEFLITDLDNYFVIPKKIKPWTPEPPTDFERIEAETSKAKARRQREGFFKKYCRGKGIDIGWGYDPVLPNCSVWDIENGDAQYLREIPDEYFDFVYSSHCLEHMRNVRISLQNWFRVLKYGGYLIVAIPHRDLYEKKKSLPSRWNSDHKHMFLIGKEETPDTLDIISEVKSSLKDYDIEYVKKCDEGNTITAPLIHSDGEYQIELVIKK